MTWTNGQDCGKLCKAFKNCENDCKLKGGACKDETKAMIDCYIGPMFKTFFHCTEDCSAMESGNDEEEKMSFLRATS